MTTPIPISKPTALPKDGVGVGLRPVHYEAAFADPAGVDWFEVIAENFLATGPVPAENLQTACALRPVAVHGVSLNLLGSDPLNSEHLSALHGLLTRTGAPCFSDHLCWTRQGDWHSHDLLPTPFTADFLEHAVRRARRVQDALPVPFAIENLSSYVDFASSQFTEWEFYTRVVREAKVWHMLDLNNIFVSSCNHGFDPVTYLESMDWDRVVYVHLAGHMIRPDGLRIDTHDHPVCPEVWELYRKAWTLAGPFPSLIEWDDQIPSWDRLREEVETARQVRSVKGQPSAGGHHA